MTPRTLPNIVARETVPNKAKNRTTTQYPRLRICSPPYQILKLLNGQSEATPWEVRKGATRSRKRRIPHAERECAGMRLCARLLHWANGPWAQPEYSTRIPCGDARTSRSTQAC